jgi:hypothetical protein
MAGHRRAEATPSFGRLCPAMTIENTVIARSESDEAIQNLAAAELDCFAYARNDETGRSRAVPE